MNIYNYKGMKVPGMIQDGGALPKAYVGGALKQVVKGIPGSLKRIFKKSPFKLKDKLRMEARRVKNTFKGAKSNKRNIMKRDKRGNPTLWDIT